LGGEEIVTFRATPASGKSKGGFTTREAAEEWLFSKIQEQQAAADVVETTFLEETCCGRAGEAVPDAFRRLRLSS